MCFQFFIICVNIAKTLPLQETRRQHKQVIKCISDINTQSYTFGYNIPVSDIQDGDADVDVKKTDAFTEDDPHQSEGEEQEKEADGEEKETDDAEEQEKRGKADLEGPAQGDADVSICHCNTDVLETKSTHQRE